MMEKFKIGPFLEHLHHLLVKLCLEEFLLQDEHGDRLSPHISNVQFIEETMHNNIIDLYNYLYYKLVVQFDELVLGPSSSVAVLDENICLTADTKLSSAEFLLLLRCSMMLLKFLAFNQTLVLEGCRLLITLLEKLSPPNSPLQFSHVDAVTSKAGISANFSSAILEVFLDEFLICRDLWKYFNMAYCSLDTKEKENLFVSKSPGDAQVITKVVSSHFLENLFVSKSPGDVQVITKVVSSHFLLAAYDESSIVRFFSSLFWSNEGCDKIPAFSLCSSLVLLSVPVIFSAPYLLRAHMILLASGGIGICRPTDAKKLDELKMKHYIRAFDLSVRFYLGIIPNLNLFTCAHRNESKSSFGAEGPVFHSCIQSLAYDMLKQQIDKVIDLCRLHSDGLHSGTRAEILDNSIAYIKGNQSFIDETFRDEACSILERMVNVLLARECQLLCEDKANIHQEMCFIAALLKLMSSALLQLVWYMREKGYSGVTRNADQLLFGKDLDVISEIICSFGNYGCNHRIHKILFGSIERSTGRHHDIKLMIAHFASLLSYSFTKRVDFLWKGCIFMMIPLMNLLAIEEGNLDAFCPLRKRKKYACLHTSENLFPELSCVKIVANLKKVSQQIVWPQHEDNSMGGAEISETGTPGGKANPSNAFQIICAEKRDDTCTADAFKYLEGFRNKETEWEYLDDFVLIDPERDYSSWMERRGLYSNWKLHKIV